MKLSLYQIDAFTDKVFGGNPAAVIPLESWIDDKIMQQIAAENNLSETTFFVKGNEAFHIRWFTPVKEVDLCGHATLAAAYVIFKELGFAGKQILFTSLSGELKVNKLDDVFQLDFPAIPSILTSVSQALHTALGTAPQSYLRTKNGWAMAVYESEEQVRDLNPYLPGLVAEDAGALIATAPGKSADFVSRVFAPIAGIPEDPVTGSAHCVMVPYWAKRLGQVNFKAVQISKRRGELDCQLKGDRVLIGGKAVLFMKGEISL